jgi:hypothetical protein
MRNGSRRLAALLVAALTAGCTSTPAAPGIVPWVDRTASPPIPPPSPRPPSPAYRSCAASSIRAQASFTGAAAGNISNRITLTNIGATPCTLSGYPTSLTGIRADGTQQPLHPTHGTMFDDAFAWPANLRPGQAAGVSIATADGCAALNTTHLTRRARRAAFVGARIGLPGGGTVTARSRFNSACGVGLSRIGIAAQPAPDPHLYAGLDLSVQHPASALAGTTMIFTVTLSNHSGHAVALRPCPVYEEGIYALGQAAVHIYRLNCGTVRSIAAGRRVSYAMRMPVPAAPGLAKLSWTIPAGGLFGGGVLTIVRGSSQ